MLIDASEEQWVNFPPGSELYAQDRTGCATRAMLMRERLVAALSFLACLKPFPELFPQSRWTQHSKLDTVHGTAPTRAQPGATWLVPVCCQDMTTWEKAHSFGVLHRLLRKLFKTEILKLNFNDCQKRGVRHSSCPSCSTRGTGQPFGHHTHQSNKKKGTTVKGEDFNFRVSALALSIWKSFTTTNTKKERKKKEAKQTT